MYYFYLAFAKVYHVYERKLYFIIVVIANVSKLQEEINEIKIDQVEVIPKNVRGKSFNYE